MSVPPGCSSLLSPPFAASPPALLRGSGPWQRCGAFGAGGVQEVRVAARAARAVAVSYAGDAYVLGLPDLDVGQRFSHGSGRVAYAAISADGTRVATLNDLAGQVAIWDTESGALLREITRTPAWPSYASGTADLAFSSDGTRLAVASAAHLEVYDVATGAPLPISLRTDGDNGNRLAFVDGDRRLAVVDYGFFGNGPYTGGTRVDVMDADTGDNRVTLPATYFVPVPDLRASADGSTIAIHAHANDGIQFFDAHTGAEIPHAFIDAELIALSADGTEVAVLEGQWRNQLTVHRISDGTVVASMTAPNFYDNGMGSARGMVDMTSDLSLALFADIPSNPVLTAATIADGATTGKACAYGHSSAVTSLEESRDGLRLVSGGGGYMDETRIVWDTHTGEPVAGPEPADLDAMDPVSPNGQYTAVPRGDDSFEVRANSSGSPLAVLRPHVTHVRQLDWSWDSRLILSIAERDPIDRWSNPESVKVWDFASRALVQTLEAAADDLPALFAAHGDTIYVAGWDTTQMWCR